MSYLYENETYVVNILYNFMQALVLKCHDNRENSLDGSRRGIIIGWKGVLWVRVMTDKTS
jgi:hypothetical protein